MCPPRVAFNQSTQNKWKIKCARRNRTRIQALPRRYPTPSATHAPKPPTSWRPISSSPPSATSSACPLFKSPRKLASRQRNRLRRQPRPHRPELSHLAKPVRQSKQAHSLGLRRLARSPPPPHPRPRKRRVPQRQLQLRPRSRSPQRTQSQAATGKNRHRRSPPQTLQANERRDPHRREFHRRGRSRRRPPRHRRSGHCRRRFPRHARREHPLQTPHRQPRLLHRTRSQTGSLQPQSPPTATPCSRKPATSASSTTAKSPQKARPPNSWPPAAGSPSSPDNRQPKHRPHDAALQAPLQRATMRGGKRIWRTQ